MRFWQMDPTLENYWRGIILFGKNVASYKFALASALYELKQADSDLIRLEDLAVPFSAHLCRHLRHAPKQITSRNSQFLNACAQHNDGELSQEALRDITVRLGFSNVIDAFHVVNRAEIDRRFFIDERKTNKGIRLTEEFYRLTGRRQFDNLVHETDARWRLVEQAWATGVSRNLIAVEYGEEDRLLYSRNGARRVAITSCRDSLNGYQKGHCFYCGSPVSLEAGSPDLADVDHFIPWLARVGVPNINGVWNLVLACRACNRGVQGKLAHVPSLRLLNRLHARNEYFINSHLPLRETLILQTGKTEPARRDFLNRVWNTAQQMLIHQWEPQAAGPDRF